MEASAPGRKEPFGQAGPQDSRVPISNPTHPPPPSAAAFGTLRQHTQAPKTRAPKRNHHPSTRASPQPHRPQTWTSREQPQPKESPRCSHRHGHASRGQRLEQLLKSIRAPTHRRSDRHTAASTRTRTPTHRGTKRTQGARTAHSRRGSRMGGQGPDCSHSERPAALPPLPAPVRPALPAAPPHVPRLRLSPRRRRRRTRRTGRREGPGRGCGPAGGGGDSGAEGPPQPRPRLADHAHHPLRPCGSRRYLRGAARSWQADPGSKIRDPHPGPLPPAPEGE